MYRQRGSEAETNLDTAGPYPNIITIYDIASENGTDFIAMEYVPVKALHQLISRKGLPLGEAVPGGDKQPKT